MKSNENVELALTIREFTNEELFTAIASNEEKAEEGYNVFTASFDNDILYGEDALDALSHDLYLDELKSRN